MLQTHWNKPDEEMFTAPPQNAYEDETFADAFKDVLNQEIEQGRGTESVKTMDDAVRILVHNVDCRLDKHLDKTNGYIGAFPQASFTFGTPDSGKGKKDVAVDFFRSWRFLPKGVTDWDSGLSASYPAGRLSDALSTASAVFTHGAPARYALRRAWLALLHLLLAAELALFFLNESTVLVKDFVNSIVNYFIAPEDNSLLGSVHIFDNIRSAVQGFIKTAPLLSAWEAASPGLPLFLFDALFGIVLFLLFGIWLYKYLREEKRFFRSLAALMILVGYPLFFAAYPHKLAMIPMCVAGIGLLLALVYILADLLKWLSRAIKHTFSRRIDTDKVRTLTARFEDQAFRLHRYARLRILWANAEHGGKYPQELDMIEKRLRKADRIVRRYGVE